MINKLGPKLIAVLDANTLNLYQAEGLKISTKLESVSIHSDENHNNEKHNGFYQKKSAQSSFFDPHTSQKDLAFQEAARSALKHINNIFFDNSKPLFNELYIIANAEMLGHCNKLLGSNLKKFLAKEIPKDLVKHNIADIEKTLFSPA
jgi:protein required for attachment to host cells